MHCGGVSDNMGMEKHTWGQKYCQKAQYAASRLRDEDAMWLAYVVDWRRRCFTAKSLFPDGEIRAPNVRKEAVVSILGTSMGLSIAFPDVSWSEPGECSIIFNLAIPALLHFHEITYQKLFSMQIAPPGQIISAPIVGQAAEG